GGLGTLDELFEILTWRQLRQHDKPIVVVNVAGYWDALGALLDRMISESYVPESNRRLLKVVATPEAAIEALRAVPPPEVAADTRHL
ncbi:MAG: LOG family protein, partial [Alphaproteobacteria bacterium]|nr:LOG family protein [Alphaproteobacteria bacterium]